MLEVVEAAHVVSSEKLRGVVSFALQISDKSTVTQEIIMEATCPYLKFSTQVPQAHSRRNLWRNLKNDLLNRCDF